MERINEYILSPVWINIKNLKNARTPFPAYPQETAFLPHIRF